MGLALAASTVQAEVEPSAEAPPTSEALLQILRRAPAFSARFTEEKTLAMLQKPLLTEGRMLFRREPPTLVRAIEEPRPMRVVITEARLSTVRGQGVEHLELEGKIEAQALVGSLLALLRGDGEALASSYALEYAHEGPRWTLRLVPRSERLAALVRRLTFEGKGEALHELVVEEASGDRTVTRVSDLRWRDASDSADAALFAVP